MSVYTLQVINNANQAQQGLLRTVLPPDDLFTWLASKAKSKLKLKSTPLCLYLEGGESQFDAKATDETIVQALEQSHKESPARPIKLYFSAGEVYAGPSGPLSSTEHAKGKYRVIANQATVAPDAYKQLKETATLEGMLLAVGMPDLHPGNKGGCAPLWLLLT